MGIRVEEIKIVEYTPAYSKAVADMWQRSAKGWNGEYGSETEESILEKHENSTNINTYLAVLGNEVVGYCAFTRYLEDEGALYISLLNARYDLHGQGIGKALVKKAVERTIELRWPRLDVHTWNANTKAIPLYKKCGYFYENKQDTTHLMNFIPTVMNTEAVEEFFYTADWYEDLKMSLDLNPDGRVENDFEFYEYKWEKNNKLLRMEFERYGRGLRLIETDDYIISVSTPKQNLIFGKTYIAKYEIINKSGNPLDIEIIGQDDKNIEFYLNKSIQVKDKEVITGEFYVSEIEEEYENFKTHPAIVSKIFINGKSALFKLGIVPKFPLTVKMCCEDILRYPGEEFDIYIDMESCLEDRGIFEFQLNISEYFETNQKNFRIILDGREKRSLKISGIMKKSCVYKNKLLIDVLTKDKENIKFKMNIGLILRGYSGKCAGEIDDKYYIINGKYKIILDKILNKYVIYDGNVKKEISLWYPKIGMPYSEEFSNIIIENITWYEEDGKIVFKGDHISKKNEGIIVTVILKLSDVGILEYYYEVENKSKEREIYIDQSFHYRIEGATFAYDNKIIHSTEPRADYPSFYNIKKLNENWIYSPIYGSLIWPIDAKISFDGWDMHVENYIGNLKSGEKCITKTVYYDFSNFKSYEEVRRFALQKNIDYKEVRVEDVEVTVNSNNPFVDSSFEVNLIENKEIPREGKISVKSRNHSFSDVETNIKEARSAEVLIIKEANLEHDNILIECDFDAVSYSRESLIFYTGNNDEVKTEEYIKDDKMINLISNGVIELKASKDFSPGIFSLKFHEKQWLDTGFPNRGSKAWYNPWFGGILNVPRVGMLEKWRSLLKENINVEFVSEIDNKGNKWSGIKSSINIKHEDGLEGLEVNQYFLMLPGVPILLNLVELRNGMNMYMDKYKFTNAAFFKIGDDIKRNWISVKNHSGDINKYRSGIRGYQIISKQSNLYGCDDIDYKVQVYCNENKYNKETILSTENLVSLNSKSISLAPGERKLLPNIFYIFTKERIEDKLLHVLDNINFNYTDGGLKNE